MVKAVEPSIVRLDVKSAGRNSIGSGFVLDRRTVVTNYHVIEGSSEAQVSLKGGAKINVLGFKAIAPERDLALLAVELPEHTPALTLAVDEPEKGSEVLAFGAPEGLEWSVSKGIVSAVRTGNELKESLGTLEGKSVYDLLGLDTTTKWVQTDAAINHGNSGGPLINLRRKVVGVNTLVSPEARNLNFAVCATEVQRLLTAAKVGQVQPLAALPPPRRVATTKPPEVPAARKPIRFDGVYQWGSAYYGYLRFYPGGTVIACRSYNEPDEVAGWLYASNKQMAKHIAIGSYVITETEIGTRITFTTRLGAAEVDWSGRVSGDYISLEWYSHTTKKRMDGTFGFVKAPVTK